MDIKQANETQAISSFPLPPSVRRKFLESGFCYASDFEGLDPVQLSQQSGISPQDAVSALKLIVGDSSSNTESVASHSALELLQKERASIPILTFCDELDSLLGNGVPVGKITEFCGVPGVGKTQLGMQLAVDVQIPAIFGGPEGSAVYIDTEGSLVPERVSDIAGGVIRHLRRITDINGSPEEKAMAAGMSVEAMLRSIHVVRCYDATEQAAAIAALPEFIQNNPKVQLVIVDSIAFHFRHTADRDYSRRNKVLMGMAATLSHLARSQGIAVVLMNQVTTKFAGGLASLAPALGESWGHAATHRVVLFWDSNNQRAAALFKSPTNHSSVAHFEIARSGVRGIHKSQAPAS